MKFHENAYVYIHPGLFIWNYAGMLTMLYMFGANVLLFFSYFIKIIIIIQR